MSSNTIRKFFVVLLILFCTLSLLNFAKAQSSQVTSQSMQAYAQTVISTYIQETNHYFPETPSNLTFYSDATYNVTFYSSSQGGAGLLFEPSLIQAFETINTTDRIDIAIFGGDPSLPIQLHAPPKEISITFQQGAIFKLEPPNLPFMDFPNADSSIMLRNLQLERANLIQTYYFLIIRGSNLTSHWTTQTAIVEATTRLDYDTGQSFVNSQYFKQLLAIPELTSLLENIKGNLTNPNYTSTEYLTDLQKVQAIAKQYGINNDILNDLIQFVNAQATGVLPTFPPSSISAPTPEKTLLGSSYADSWYYATGFIAYFIILYPIDLAVKSKQKKPKWKKKSDDIWDYLKTYGVEICLGAGGLTLFVANLPLNASYLPLQVAYVVILSLTGIFALSKAKSLSKKLTAWRFSRSKK